MTPEIRHIELRHVPETGTLAGTLMVYNSVAELPWGKEVFRAGAFGPDISKADVLANLQHDRTKPIARSPDGGLTLIDSPAQLSVDIHCANTTAGRDAYEGARAGLYRGLSVEFVPIEERQLADGTREISKARLYGFGIVDRPIYEDTVITAMRSRYHVANKGRDRRLWL